MTVASQRRYVQDATLCLPVVDGRVLLIRKKRGVGAGLYNGPGGKIEPGETPREAVVREVREEVGLSVAPEKCGELAFTFGGDPFMFVHVYRADEYDGTPRETEEAVPRWYPVDDLPYDEMWPDDRYWFPLMLDGRPFRGTFHFTDDGEEMDGWELDADVDL